MTRNETTKLLIVDDEQNMLLVLKDAVMPLGCTVEVAATLDEAQQKLKSFEPDVILCDLRLDRGSGLELLQTAKTLPRAPEFVFLSGHGSIEAAVQAMKGGAYDFLIKPVADKVLIEALSHSIEQSKKKRGMSGEGRGALRSELEERERSIIVGALERNQWIQAKAARELGLERSHLHYKLKKYGLTVPGRKQM